MGMTGWGLKWVRCLEKWLASDLEIVMGMMMRETRMEPLMETSQLVLCSVLVMDVISMG